MIRPLLLQKPLELPAFGQKPLVAGPVQQVTDGRDPVRPGVAVPRQDIPQDLARPVAGLYRDVEQRRQGDHRGGLAALQFGGWRLHLQGCVQHHAVVPGVLAVAMGGPVLLANVDFHVPLHQAHAFYFQQSVAKVGPGGMAGPARVEHPHFGASLALEPGLSRRAALPQAGQQVLGNIGPAGFLVAARFLFYHQRRHRSIILPQEKRFFEKGLGNPFLQERVPQNPLLKNSQERGTP